MSYDGNPQTTEAANDALELSDANADESPEGELGDGGAFGKYCFLEGKYKRSCQNCTGLACGFFK